MLCEKCGKEMQVGYGLAGGGIGPYFYCETEGCDGFEKFQDPELEQPMAKLADRFTEILSPAINMDAPYAKQMLKTLLQAVVEEFKGK